MSDLTLCTNASGTTGRRRRVRPWPIVVGVALACLSGPALASGPSTSSGSSDDGRILYINSDTDHRLETMNPDGSGVVPLTDVEGFVLHPVWTPGASGIVFVSDAAGPFQLEFIEPDGTGQRTILADRPDFQAFNPAVTPDGERIVFTRCRPDGGCALYTVGFDGSDLTRLTRFGDGDGDFWPDVAPNGRRVAYTRFGVGGINAQTWIVRMDGSNAHPITPPKLEAARPRWLPGGKRLLLADDWVHFGNDILSIRADGSGLRRLTSTQWPHSASSPSPSPSGNRIVYIDDTAYPDLIGFDLFLMNADGSGKQLLRSGSFANPEWGTGALVPASSGTGRTDSGPSNRRPTLPRELAEWVSALEPGHGLTNGR